MKTVATIADMDSLTSFMKDMPGKTTRAKNSGMSSVGWNLKRVTKTEFANNTQSWPLLSPITASVKKNRPNTTHTKVKIRRTKSVKTLSKFWGSLKNLVVYSYDKQSGDLDFGFQAGTFGRKFSHTRSDGTRVYRDNVLGSGVVALAKRLTIGGNTRVTQKMKRYFWALGIYVKTGTYLKTPARPIIGPVLKSNDKNIGVWFANKFWERLRKYSVGA